MTFAEIQSFADEMNNLELDFEEKELEFRQEIWHLRVDRLKALMGSTSEERVKCDEVMLWFEES